MLRKLCTADNRERITPKRDGLCGFLLIPIALKFFIIIILKSLLLFSFTLFTHNKNYSVKSEKLFFLGNLMFKKNEPDLEDWALDGPHCPWKQDFPNSETLIEMF